MLCSVVAKLLLTTEPLSSLGNEGNLYYKQGKCLQHKIVRVKNIVAKVFWYKFHFSHFRVHVRAVVQLLSTHRRRAQVILKAP